MSILCVKYWGLADPQAINNLHALLCRLKPSIVFLAATEQTSYEMSHIKNKFGEFDGVYTDCHGQASGLTLLWKKHIVVSLLPHSSHHIDIQIDDGLGPSP